jgi:hypothetical protein
MLILNFRLLNCNEEDGLKFAFDKKTETISAKFNGVAFSVLSDLEHMLRETHLFPVYLLRATIVVCDSIRSQIGRLNNCEMEGPKGSLHWEQACILRNQERNLFNLALDYLSQ